jgi:hypothetical protein
MMMAMMGIQSASSGIAKGTRCCSVVPKSMRFSLIECALDGCSGVFGFRLLQRIKSLKIKVRKN